MAPSCVQSASCSISVVLPCHNAARTIGRAIDSVLAQDTAAFELIVVDDGSSDASRAIIAGRAQKDDRIVFLPLESRGGANAARNAGVGRARAPLVAFLDADDAYFPGKVAAVLAFFTAHPEVDVLIDSFELEKAGRMSRRIAPDLLHSATVIEKVLRREINKPTPALTIRRAALDAAGLFDVSLRRRQDLSLLLRLTETGARFASTSQVLWRKHAVPGSISATTKTPLPALRHLCEAHPIYLQDRRYRSGAARDFATYLWRLVLTGRLILAADEYRLFAKSQGWTNSAQLASSGTVHIIRQALRTTTR